MEKFYQQLKTWLLNISLIVLIVTIIFSLGIIVLYIFQSNMVFSICAINNLFENKTALISGILIGLSALLASTTIMKSMQM